MTRFVALIGGIGAATHARMSMADLRAGCEAAGLVAVRTLLATGNLGFEAEGPEAAHDAVAGVLAAHGVERPVVLRAAAALPRLLARNPFPEAAAERPDRLLVHYLPAPWSGPAPEWDGPERIALRGREVFVDYARGVGRSKLTGAALARLAGPGGTARNWNTSQKLCDI